MPPKPIIKTTLVKTGSRTDNRVGGHPHGLKKGNKGMSRIMDDDKKNPKIPEEHSFSEQEEALQQPERELSEQELNQDVAKMLQPNNPQAPHNMTQYSFRERVFKKDELVDQLVIHFSTDGEFIHKESNEFKTQDEINENRASAINEAKRAMAADDPSARREAESEEGLKKLKRTLRNKFNYNERQSQTVNESVRDRGVSTQPPPVKRLAMELTQWDIWDSYITEFSKDEPLRIATADGGSIKVEGGVVKPPATAGSDKSIYPASFRRSMKIMERMVVQNIEQEKYHDYKYYFTEKDMPDISNAEGSILPIWRITSEKQRKKHVTSLAWNPRYSDFFAVGLGSYNFNRQAGQGYICCYSLKNTKYPEYFFTTPKGVMSIDFHPKSPALLAVGLYDGTVMVFDIRSKHKKPIYKSTVRTMKHTEPVWQVYWNPDNTKNYSFFSISSDGRVTQWVLMKNKLEPEDMMKLKLVADSTGEDGSNLIGYACGLCFDFNKFEPGIFLVGTEEGKIHKCNLAYSGQYQETYEGHIQAVYKVRWNNFHSKTFISASADWTVKVWDSRYKTPIISIDLGTQVVDAAWSPCSSVVFSVCTLDKIQVYDLIFDKLGKRAETKPTKQAKLTNLVFSAKDPVILVGDDHGGVTVLKLSPNLTPHMVKTGNNEVVPEGKTVQQYEEEKMENMLNLVGKFEKDDM